MVSTVNATDFEDSLEDYELDLSNTVNIESNGNIKVKLNNDDIEDLKDGDCVKIIKTKKNYKLKKTPTKKTKKITFKTTLNPKIIKKKLTKIKKGKGGKWALSCQFYNNCKVSKILDKNKIKSYKFSKFTKWVDSPGGYYKQTFYKVTVNYNVCKVKKVVKPLKVHIHVNYNKLFSDDSYDIGCIKYKDARGFTYKYWFDDFSDDVYIKMGI